MLPKHTRRTAQLTELAHLTGLSYPMLHRRFRTWRLAAGLSYDEGLVLVRARVTCYEVLPWEEERELMVA